MSYLTIWQVQSELIAGKLSCESLVNDYLAKIEASKHLNAFLEVFTEGALQRARLLDKKLKNGEPTGKLFGVVIAIKDNICYKGHKVSAGSKILEGFTSLFDSTVVERLLADDAIIIGRTNCDEFAMGSSNEAHQAVLPSQFRLACARFHWVQIPVVPFVNLLLFVVWLG